MQSMASPSMVNDTNSCDKSCGFKFLRLTAQVITLNTTDPVHL